jgi:hypothetical protein
MTNTAPAASVRLTPANHANVRDFRVRIIVILPGSVYFGDILRASPPKARGTPATAAGMRAAKVG